MSTYLYCFAHDSHPLPVQGLVGVGPQAPPLRLLREEELTAVVSDASGDLRPKRRDLERHQAILEALFSAGAVLPMRFGMLAPEDAAIRAEMQASAGRYRELLSRIEGHVEVNVKGMHIEDALLVDLLKQHPDLRERQCALRAAGGGSHDEMVEFGERVAAAVTERRACDAQEAVARLSPHAADVRLGPPVDGYFVNASFLVPAAARSGFEASLGRLRDELAGSAHVGSYGPLPPYSFVTSDSVDA
jgi:Gas vesicle synthesis protein GvpL/GvpF